MTCVQIYLRQFKRPTPQIPSERETDLIGLACEAGLVHPPWEWRGISLSIPGDIYVPLNLK